MVYSAIIGGTMDTIRLDLGNVNAYLLREGDSFLLIDTGGYTFAQRPLGNNRESLERQLVENGCTPGKLKLILLTHGNVDHIANGRYLRETYGAPIAIHRADAELTHDLNLEKMFANLKYEGLALKIIAAILNPLFIRMSEKILRELEPFEADELIDAGYSLAPYGFDAEIIPLEGHTRGSIGVLLKNGDFICGDTLMNLKKPAIALNAADFGALRVSVATLKGRAIGTVYPGHGNPFPFSTFR